MMKRKKKIIKKNKDLKGNKVEIQAGRSNAKAFDKVKLP